MWGFRPVADTASKSLCWLRAGQFGRNFIVLLTNLAALAATGGAGSLHAALDDVELEAKMEAADVSLCFLDIGMPISA